jgi:hypothetical protein
VPKETNVYVTQKTQGRFAQLRFGLQKEDVLLHVRPDVHLFLVIWSVFYLVLVDVMGFLVRKGKFAGYSLLQNFIVAIK